MMGNIKMNQYVSMQLLKAKLSYISMEKFFLKVCKKANYLDIMNSLQINVSDIMLFQWDIQQL